MAFLLKVDKFVPGELVQADEFYDLLANASQLFRWWAQLQRVGSRIARKYFLDACQSIDPDVQREQAAEYFDRFHEDPEDIGQRYVSFQKFCEWTLAHTSSAGEQPVIDINSAFDRYSQDGAIDHRNISKLLDDLHPGLHSNLIILAYKAASVHGNARIMSSTDPIVLWKCIKNFTRKTRNRLELPNDSSDSGTTRLP
jgi:hypothetical protein